ncbi:hypothetical protein ACFX13_012788 [Malus domestica]
MYTVLCHTDAYTWGSEDEIVESIASTLLNDGDPVLGDEIVYMTRRGTRLLNLSNFMDEAHSSSWDHSTFCEDFCSVLRSEARVDAVLEEEWQRSRVTHGR